MQGLEYLDSDENLKQNINNLFCHKPLQTMQKEKLKISLEGLCDLVTPLLLNLRKSVRSANLFGDILEM